MQDLYDLLLSQAMAIASRQIEIPFMPVSQECNENNHRLQISPLSLRTVFLT